MATSPRSPQRRLQREKDFTGDRLTSFRQVILRHGLPGVLLALVCFAVPSLYAPYVESVAKGLQAPGLYGGGALVIFLALSAYAWRIHGGWSPSNTVWILYLGALSFWEEWVFRLALPPAFGRLGRFGLARNLDQRQRSSAGPITLR